MKLLNSKVVYYVAKISSDPRSKFIAELFQRNNFRKEPILNNKFIGKPKKKSEPFSNSQIIQINPGSPNNRKLIKDKN